MRFASERSVSRFPDAYVAGGAREASPWERFEWCIGGCTGTKWSRGQNFRFSRSLGDPLVGDHLGGRYVSPSVSLPGIPFSQREPSAPRELLTRRSQIDSHRLSSSSRSIFFSFFFFRVAGTSFEYPADRCDQFESERLTNREGGEGFEEFLNWIRMLISDDMDIPRSLISQKRRSWNGSKSRLIRGWKSDLKLKKGKNFSKLSDSKTFSKTRTRISNIPLAQWM